MKMTQQEIQKLTKIKRLIYEGKRKFVNRKDRDYLDDLSNLGITEEDAWKYALSLNCNFYWYDGRKDKDYSKTALTFLIRIKNKVAYIKLDIVVLENDEEVVCWSFHETEVRR